MVIIGSLPYSKNDADLANHEYYLKTCQIKQTQSCDGFNRLGDHKRQAVMADATWDQRAVTHNGP